MGSIKWTENKIESLIGFTEVGMRVKIIQKGKFNGKYGTVEEKYLAGQPACVVTHIIINKDHVVLEPHRFWESDLEPAIKTGMKVRIHGLTDQRFTKFNNKIGTVGQKAHVPNRKNGRHVNVNRMPNVYFHER